MSAHVLQWGELFLVVGFMLEYFPVSSWQGWLMFLLMCCLRVLITKCEEHRADNSNDEVRQGCDTTRGYVGL